MPNPPLDRVKMHKIEDQRIPTYTKIFLFISLLINFSPAPSPFDSFLSTMVDTRKKVNRTPGAKKPSPPKKKAATLTKKTPPKIHQHRLVLAPLRQRATSKKGTDDHDMRRAGGAGGGGRRCWVFRRCRRARLGWPGGRLSARRFGWGSLAA